MSSLSEAQSNSRERTLLVSMLLSAWAPLATGLAVLLSQSSTQLADFIRRTVELAALFVSWFVFRLLAKRGETRAADRARLERLVSQAVAAALACSALVMLVIALSRLRSFQPGGNVTLGLVIAGLGLLTNGWFWRRYTRMTRENFNAVIDSQSRLYGAKMAVDFGVIVALSAVAISPAHPLTRYIDISGSVGVAFYLLWSSLRTWKAAPAPSAGRSPT
jgi:divalent metal cation (Fe/Co/Zn/Cd) transporter